MRSFTIGRGMVASTRRRWNHSKNARPGCFLDNAYMTGTARTFAVAVIHSVRSVPDSLPAMAQKEQKQRMLKQAVELFGRQVIAEGLKLSDATLDAWINGKSEMPDGVLMPLADLLVSLAAKNRK